MHVFSGTCTHTLLSMCMFVYSYACMCSEAHAHTHCLACTYMLSIERINWHGNTTFYNTLIDEGLNWHLRNAAQHAHAATFEKRLFRTFYMLAEFGLVQHIYQS